MSSNELFGVPTNGDINGVENDFMEDPGGSLKAVHLQDDPSPQQDLKHPPVTPVFVDDDSSSSSSDDDSIPEGQLMPFIAENEEHPENVKERFSQLDDKEIVAEPSDSITEYDIDDSMWLVDSSHSPKRQKLFHQIGSFS